MIPLIKQRNKEQIKNFVAHLDRTAGIKEKVRRLKDLAETETGG